MFCQKCGAQLADGAKFCASCGAQFGGAQAAGQSYQAAGQSYQQPGQEYQSYQPPVTQGQAQYNQGSPEWDAQQNKAMGILAYFIFFIPLLAAKESPFARYHANQGLILLIFGVGIGIISGILSAIAVAALSFGLLGIIGILITILSLGLTVLGILGIVNAAQGKMKPMPVIGSLFTIIK